MGTYGMPRIIMSAKEDKRHTLDRMIRYYQETGHTKQAARALAKNHLRFGKIKG